LAALGAVAYFAVPRARSPMSLHYDVDLSSAEASQLLVEMTLTGELPEPLELVFPPGAFVARQPRIETTVFSAAHLSGTDSEPEPLPLAVTPEGWRIHHHGKRQIRVVYQLDLSPTSSLEEDIRHHLTVPTADGFRAAGFHVFLTPSRGEVAGITIEFRHTAGGQLLAPWPARAMTPPPPGDEGGIQYHPAGLYDLTNSLLAWGDLQVTEYQLEACSLHLAVHGEWYFAGSDLERLLRRIAATEIEFFGSAPHPAVACLTTANPVDTQDSFDYYGVHAGQSVLLFLDPQTSHADLAEKAASVVAHEMFHGWLGEAIRQDDPTMLWFTEGATTWYTARMLVAAKIWTPDRAAEVLGQRISRDYFGSELLNQISVADAAARVMQDGATVRFAYAGGSLAAAALDRHLAQQTSTPHPLDDVLRHLYDQQSGQALTRDALVATVRAVCGVECDAWLDRYVYANEPLPQLDMLF
jgi:predicted metalloprotease with PDZ domain